LRDEAGMSLGVYRRPQAAEARYISGVQLHRVHGEGEGKPSAHGREPGYFFETRPFSSGVMLRKKLALKRL
jgi:hypothetical protein